MTPPSEVWDVIVVGAGIVGLATARELAGDGRRKVLVLEAEPDVAMHQSGRNSGVVHAGLYYRPGSLKARLCTEGRKALHSYCEHRQIPFRRCGKLVVATTAREAEALDELVERGKANGLEGIERLEGSRLREREPEVAGLAGLWVPQTGIVDYRGVAASLAEDLVSAGGEVRMGARVTSLRSSANEVVVESEGGAFGCRFLVNCAGLECDRIARLAGLEPGLRIVPFRGEYFALRPEAAARIRGLVYPVPITGLPFLGVHFTRTIGDAVLVGPNAVPALSRVGYRRSDLSVRDLADMIRYPGTWRLAARLWRTGAREMARSMSRKAFVESARRLVPALTAGDFVPAPSGIRAQAVGRGGELIDDFRFARNGRSLHVLNAPSPAATSALAIARVIAERLAA